MTDPTGPTVVAQFANEARAAQLVALLEAQGIEAFSLYETEPTPGGLPAHVVLLPEGEQAAWAAEIAKAFEANPDGAVDYMAAHGIVPAAPVRDGCGPFWLFPGVFVLLGVIGFVTPEYSRTSATVLLTIGLLMAAAFRLSNRAGSQNTSAPGDEESDADDVER